MGGPVANTIVILAAGLAALAFLLLGAGFALASGLLGVVSAYFGSMLTAGLVALWLRRRGAVRAEAMTRLVRLRRATVSLCAISAVGFVASFAATFVASRPPAQAFVASRLQEHRDGFERLREMVGVDRLETILDYGSWYARPQEPLIFKSANDAGLATERAAEYTRLMRSVGSQRVDIWKNGTIHFSVASWGTANRGWRVTLVWSEKEPDPLLPTIDGFPGTKPPGGPNYTFSRVEKSWYAYIVW